MRKGKKDEKYSWRLRESVRTLTAVNMLIENFYLTPSQKIYGAGQLHNPMKKHMYTNIYIHIYIYMKKNIYIYERGKTKRKTKEICCANSI